MRPLPAHPSNASQQQQRIIVETITTTTVTERIMGGITDNRINITASQIPQQHESQTDESAAADAYEEEAPALPPKESHAAKAAMLMNPEPPPGSLPPSILKGGKLWKSEMVSIEWTIELLTMSIIIPTLISLCTGRGHHIGRGGQWNEALGAVLGKGPRRTRG